MNDSVSSVDEEKISNTGTNEVPVEATPVDVAPPTTSSEGEYSQKTPTQAEAPNENKVDQQPVDEIEPTEPPVTINVEELLRQLGDTAKRAEEFREALLRQRAESDNMQKRLEREIEKAHKFALERFAKELLEVKDNLERGLEVADKPDVDLSSIREGIELTLRSLSTIFGKFGITEIDPLNQKFNPDQHEAMAIQPVPNVEEGTVIYVHQRGYQLNERLLRPARVIVAKAI